MMFQALAMYALHDKGLETSALKSLYNYPTEQPNDWLMVDGLTD